MCIYFYILFLYNILQDTEYSSICYIVGPCWLPIFKSYVFIYGCAGSLLLHSLSSGCRDWSVFFVVVHWLLILAASLV